ncbi:hypothetical protein [Salinirubrum litoreum]|uniref:Uncharacterized protein n=1 Tax=Salinirubrum litoreum TaxID=1126234 RepID=A0ABD5RBA2_9EURY|nr:hypothetical protein [Salinirubrum litoreum]
MTERGTFRLGRLKVENGSLPTVDEVADAISDDFTERTSEEDPATGEPITYQEKGRDVYKATDYDNYNFCHFTYVTDTDESFRIRDDGEEREEDQIVLEVAWVVYFENGQYAFQSRDDIAEAWIPRFIKRRTDREITNDDHRMDRIGQEELEDRFYGADRITKAKFGQSGDDDAGRAGSGGSLEELARHSSGLTFSTGQGGGGNLQDASLIREAVEELEIKRINVKNGDENMITLKESGRVEISWNNNDWDDDASARNRGQTIRRKLRPYLIAVR